MVGGRRRSCRERCLPLWKTTTSALEPGWQREEPSRCPNCSSVQCARRILDSLRVRIHPAQARPNCEAALPFADHQARAPARPEAHLRLNFSTGNERSSKGRAVAWPRETQTTELYTSRPGGETRSLGIVGASETALRAVQGFGQVNRMARGSHFYVDQKAVKIICWPGMLEAGSA